MRLYIETMDAVLVDVEADGRVRLEGGDWFVPSLRETRAIIHASRQAIEELDDLVALLESKFPA